MCRLYGFRANELTKVECTLVYAQNALLRQSASDLRGRSHSDGWGIGFYEDHRPEIERRDTAAHKDEFFSLTAARMYATTVVAHVRAATVGAHSQLNTHPFIHHTWAFAHNGTVRGFDAIGPRLVSETDPDLRELKQGDTDSETTFYWLLTRMRRADIDLDSAMIKPKELVSVFADAIDYLDRLCAHAEPEKPAQLNFLLTNGKLMVASRWRNSLHWLRRDGVQDCEICGIPHIRHSPEASYKAIVIASEPITHEAWIEVPENCILAVDERLDTELQLV
jgi:predicted glutamine amidotransferase